MKTVILTPDMVGPINNGGIGTFATNLSFLLRQQGHTVSVLFTGPTMIPSSKWEALYRERGIEVIQAQAPLDGRRASGNYWFVQRSQTAWAAIPPDTDLVYTQDWQANAFHLLRQRHYQRERKPLVVSVLHSPSAWLLDGMRIFPDDPEEQLGLDYAERYSVEHSDYVLSPSQYMLDWVQARGWKLPPEQHRRVLGYPFFPQTTTPPGGAQAATFRKLIFFGRLETRKGLELLVDTLRYCTQTLRYPLAQKIEEIVLLGKHEGQHRFVSLAALTQEIEAACSLPVTILSDFSTYQAQAYLQQAAPDSLVVMPSLVDNLPFTVIEASLIPGLNLLTSRYGGMGEILGPQGQDQLFEPFVRPFADKLIAFLEQGPKAATQLGVYDWQAANHQWLTFHEQLVDSVQPAPILSATQPSATVDICITHFNHGHYLTQLLQALAHQTAPTFGVIVQDDASTNPQDVALFEQLQAQYQPRGWRFLRNSANQGLSQTRNLAVQASQADYIIFMDSDNIPAPQMVERFLVAITTSQKDCLTCYFMAFEGENAPYAIESPYDEKKLIAKAVYRYLPLGASPGLGLFVNSFGDANWIIKRQVFEDLGGFSIAQAEYRYIVGEDQAFLANLCLAGYSLDVIPEYLFFYRHRPDSLFRTTDTYANIMRVQQVYRHSLKTVGLEELVPITYGIYQRALELPSTTAYSNPDWIARRVPWRNLTQALFLKGKKHWQKAAERLRSWRG